MKPFPKTIEEEADAQIPRAGGWFLCDVAIMRANKTSGIMMSFHHHQETVASSSPKVIRDFHDVWWIMHRRPMHNDALVAIFLGDEVYKVAFQTSNIQHKVKNPPEFLNESVLYFYCWEFCYLHFDVMFIIGGSCDDVFEAFL